jgi:hypothetical protein
MISLGWTLVGSCISRLWPGLDTHHFVGEGRESILVSSWIIREIVLSVSANFFSLVDPVSVSLEDVSIEFESCESEGLPPRVPS